MSARKSASSTPRAQANRDRAKPKGESRRGSRLGGDLVWALTALAVGALLIPPLVWITGLVIIGPYANGGLWAMTVDTFSALQQGSKAAWITFLSPLALVVIWRTTVRLVGR